MLLAKKNKPQNVENFAAMPYNDVPAFIAKRQLLAPGCRSGTSAFGECRGG
jgi:hypothetical protein